VAYHDDLLQQALELVHSKQRKPKQASLRRAVSTAYYALFHLLISIPEEQIAQEYLLSLLVKRRT
jgi:hypothetical protein